MYNIVLNGVSKRYNYLELIREFLPDDGFELYALEGKAQGTYITQEELDRETTGLENKLEFRFTGDELRLGRELCRGLEELTGIHPPWGILTGVRPVKLAGQLKDPYAQLTGEYLVSDEKARKIIDIYGYQASHSGRPPQNSISVYVGIPFCPSRCGYCSFTSNEPGGDSVERYLAALEKEIRESAALIAGRNIESVYIGGGTPTTLSERQLDELLSCLDDELDLRGAREFSVEAGRPDTITFAKLEVLKKHGVDRISINPQSMKQETLDLIGRAHTPEMIREAFAMAGAFTVNADVIAGLPREDVNDFEATLREVMALGADNITVHSLAVKRASAMKESDPDFHHKRAAAVEEMISRCEEILAGGGYRPYYLYRQKHMAGNLENTGYCRDDKYCLYNIRIMEEKQSVIAFGAGGISKIYHAEEDRLERIANVSNYEIYIERIDEMIRRKESGIC